MSGDELIDRGAPPAWLLKELIVWRGLAVLLLIVFIGVTLTTYLADRQQHAADNKERAEHWTRLEGLAGADGRAIERLDETLRACAICHAHPDLDEMLRRLRERRKKP